MLVGLLAAGVIAYLCRGIDTAKINPFILPGAALLIIAFYRTIGNPLEEDTSREFFVLVPEPPFKKVFFSLLGSLAVNAIDFLPPLMLARMILNTDSLTLLVWYVFILSVTLFGTAVGAFVNLSIPGDHAQTLKVMLQVLFLYFGLVPTAMFVIVGILLKNVGIFVLLGASFNVGLALIFSIFIPKFLVNR